MSEISYTQKNTNPSPSMEEQNRILNEVLEEFHRNTPYELEVKDMYPIYEICRSCGKTFKTESVMNRCCSNDCLNNLITRGKITLDYIGGCGKKVFIYFGKKMVFPPPKYSIYKKDDLMILLSVLEKLDFSADDLYLVHNWCNGLIKEFPMNCNNIILTLSNENGVYQLSRTLIDV